MKKTTIIILSILALLFNACSNKEEQRLTLAKELLAQANPEWVLTKYIDEMEYDRYGEKHIVMRLQGNFHDGQQYIALIQYLSNSDEHKKIGGYYIKSNNITVANGTIFFPDGTISTYTNYAQIIN